MKRCKYCNFGDWVELFSSAGCTWSKCEKALPEEKPKPLYENDEVTDEIPADTAAELNWFTSWPR